MLDRAGKFPEVPAMSVMRFSSHISESEKVYVFNRIFLNQKSVCFQSHISESEKCVNYPIYAKWFVDMTQRRKRDFYY